jgi:hypothetical protein
MTKEKKTAEELAAMIGEDLSNIDGCPKRGVTVTVYGLNPWNSMLSASMPVPSPIRPSYRDFVTSSPSGTSGYMTLLSRGGFRASPLPSTPGRA